jgi:hypothetical protein
MGASMAAARILESAPSSRADTRVGRSFRIPLGVQEKVSAASARNFDYVRCLLNKALAADPETSLRFDEESLAEMREGRNPYAPLDQRRGKRVKMEWDHYRERRENVRAPCDLSNLRLVSPDTHVRKIGYRFNSR